MEITFTLTPELYLRYTREYVAWQRRHRWIPILFTALLIATIYSFLDPPTATFDGQPAPPATIWVLRLTLQIPIATLLLFGLWEVITRVSSIARAKHAIRKLPEHSWGERRFSIEDGSVTLHSTEFEVRLVASAITKVVETPSAVILLADSQPYFFLPAEQVDVAALRDRLKDT